MKGTIKIIADGENHLAFELKMGMVTTADKMLIFDSLADALRLNVLDRVVIGDIISKGGIGKITGVSPEKTVISKEVIEMMQKKGRGKNEDVEN